MTNNNIRLLVSELIALNGEKYSEVTLLAMVDMNVIDEAKLRAMIVAEKNSPRARMLAETAADMAAAAVEPGKRVLEGVSSVELFAGRTKPKFFLGFGLKGDPGRVFANGGEPDQVAFDLLAGHAFAVRIEASAFHSEEEDKRSQRGMWLVEPEKAGNAVFFNVKAIEDIHNVGAFSFGLDWARNAVIPTEEGYIMQVFADRHGCRKALTGVDPDLIRDQAEDMLDAIFTVVEMRIQELVSAGQKITLEGVIVVPGVYNTFRRDKNSRKLFIETFAGKDKVRANLIGAALWEVGTRNMADSNLRLGNAASFNIRGGIQGHVERSGAAQDVISMADLLKRAVSDDASVRQEALKSTMDLSRKGKINPAQVMEILKAADSVNKKQIAEVRQTQNETPSTAEAGRDASTNTKVRKGGLR